ncbi:MAG: hypothetical protein HY978_04975 [Candidatus Liptonbacteria bacterium]|nr:hypothetical protein [Candidatus Liptonbacteria bacterium]
MKNILKELLKYPAVTGCEKNGGVSQAIYRYVNAVPGARAKIDAVGNVIATKGSGKRKIMWEAHLDEVGFLVSKIISSKLLQSLPIGGVDAKKVTRSKVVIKTRKSEVVGVVERDFRIRVKSTQGVRLGDWIYFARNIVIQNELITSPALDNKVGCAAVLEALRQIKVPQGWQVVVLFSARHEVGTRVGLGDLVYRFKPKLILVCDAAYASPDGKKNWCVPKIGGGPAVQLLGKDFVVSKDMVSMIINAARREGIPYQLEIPDQDYGGTDASKIPNNYPFAVINVPVSRQHTSISRASILDTERCARLIAAFSGHMFRDRR